jgi:copper(I)-binding protein
MGSVTFSPALVGVGGEVRVDCSYSSANGDGNYYDAGIYLSTDSTITTDDIYLGNIALYSGSGSHSFTDYVVTGATPAGQYYVGVILDYMNQLAESNEGNNAGASSSRLTISAEKPDLTVLAVDATNGTSFVVGDRVYVHARIKNLATNVPAPSSTVYFVLSPDTTITATDTYATHLIPSSLAAQETRDLYDSFIVTTNMVGQYYLGAFIDPGNDIDESNEGNNAACGQRLTMQSASLPPDFAVALITISPSTPIQGGSFNATVTVTNQGNGAGDGGYLNVWVNQPNPVNPGDGTWNQSWRVDTVSVGQSKAFTFTNLTAPSALGTYTFHAFIDGPGKTPESNEANNQLDLSYQVAPLPVPRIILDTDMSADCDDLGAVAVLHALANQGKAEILGMVCNVSDPNSPLCLDAINRYYGRTNIPVGYLNTNSVNPFMNPIFQFFEHYDFNNEYTEYIASHHNHIEPNEVRDALDVYVSLLQTNSGVTIVSIGSLYNLDRLLSERPDLVSNKVAKLVVMGGSYPVLSFPFFDFNFTLAGDAAKRVVANWPTPIVFSGLGGDVITGDGLDILGIPIIGATGLFNNPNVATNNPIMEGYREGTRTTRIDCFLNWAAPIVAVHFRPSWDQIAVLYAVEGISTNFLEVGPGKNIVNLGTNSVSILDTPVLSLTIASNQWGYQSGGNHYYLTNLVSNIELSVRIDSLMTAPVGANPQATKIIGLSGNLAFGSIQTGQTVTATLTIVNTGNAALNVSGINYPLGFSGAWTGNIAAGGSHDVMVTFAPTSVTTYGGSITVNSDANSGVGSISVSGSGMAGATRIIGVSGNLAFGSVQTGQTGMATLIVTNTGNATLHVSSIDYPPGFSGTWSDSIASGGSHTVVVTFTPTALTTYGGTVTVNSDATSGNNTINASGTGTTVATRIIGVSGNLAFGTIQTGQVATTTLIIANTGSSTLNVSGISYPPGFSGTWSDSIASGGSHNVVVTFAPTAVTMYGGTVTVNSDATSGTSALSVSGSGVSMRSISVLSPNGGESWQAGQTNNITWNSSGFSDPVNLELYDGNIFRTIHYDTPNVGSWAWSIPGDIRQGTNYYIFVYWVSNGVITTVRDYSDGPFTISAATNAQTGALQVTISPPGAVGAGAQWQIDGGPWENGGDIVGGLATGIHDVSFKAVAGWTTPTSQTSTVTEGQTNVLLANYIQVPGPWSDGWEPWWAATTDPDRNMFIADPLGQRGTVLQVWGEHGWWATFRKPIVGGTKYLRAEGWFMAGGGDAGPWIVFRESLDGASAVDVARFGFDDGAVPPTISGHAVQNNVWYKFTFEADVSAGWWKGWVNEVPIAQGAVDTNRTINWICLDAGQPGYFGDVSYLSKSVVCAEDFQSYGVNSWPSANWTADANALSSPNNNRVEYSPSGGTNKVLKLFGAIGGCWAALTYRSCVFPTNFWIECDVYNGAETLTGCHPDRAWISMRSGASWRNPGRWLLAFQGPRTISGSDVALGTYQPGRWYHVAINYCRSGTNLTVGYWINGAWAGQAALTVDNLSQEQSLDHIELTAQEGSAFFDNLSVYTRAAQAATDSDGCGLPDWWKLLFFGTITGVDPYADPDHDGIINLHEFFAGTSPIDSNSALQVKGIAWEGSAVNIRFQSVNGKRYAVEYADSIGAASWMPLFAESVLGDGSEMSIRAPVSTDAGSRFYRIRVLNW